MKNKIYIVLLNYKGWKDTIECLESVFKLENVNFQILLVDNSPTLESLQKIENWASGEKNFEIETQFTDLVYPLIKKPLEYIVVSEEQIKIQYFDHTLVVIKAVENKGFSAGNNIALNYALNRDDFQFCWLLNNDTVVEKKSLINQLDYIKGKAAKTGILGSVLVDYFQPNIIQAIGGALNTKTFLTNHVGEGLNTKNFEQKVKNRSIDYVVGASMLVSREFLKDVGILSEDFFLYFEELDWAYRAKSKSWEVDWCPNSLVYHKEGKSIGSSKNYKKRSFTAEIESFKSRKIFFEKYFRNRIHFNFYSILIIMNRVRRFQFRLIPYFIRILIR
ncbi:glycosyltransferase family 2 protein [Aquimarina rubra]|uniref:Glycosyltransferase family 2 protein n=1 Tax=Aquimarina rubra TaxID=1920033 RepID=A0ABW5LFA9_9FLAO